MTDFETHPRGTADEIILSRKLSAVIEDMRLQWGNDILPIDVCRANDVLIEHYMKQMEREQ